MIRLKEIWILLLLQLALTSSTLAKSTSFDGDDSIKSKSDEVPVYNKNKSTIPSIDSSKSNQSSHSELKPSVKNSLENKNFKKLDFHNAEFESAFKHDSLHPTIVPFPLIYNQIFGAKKDQKNEKLFIHKFGNLRNLISQKQWMEIQGILNQKTPLRTKHFEITKILTEQTKFNKSQIQIFWNDFFDFHVMKKVLMLHNKILQSFGQKSIDNYGIYDVEISVETKVKLLNAQIKRYLPSKDYEIYAKIQSKVFELSKSEKEALLL